MIPDPTALPDEETETAGRWQLAGMRLGPIVAYFVGFLVFFRDQIFSGFDLNFGDRGDARFVVFIHESVFRWLSGARGDLLSPPFFFNQTRTLGYSDAFLLNQAFYAPLRLVGADPFLAMSLVPPLLSAVGYAFAYLLFRRLGVSVAMATLGSPIFTFANNLFLKAGHLQHFAVYFLPVVVYCLVTAVTRLHSRPHQACVLGACGAALFALVFATAYYTAWFFGFDLILFTPGFAWIAWPALRNWSRTGPRRVVALAVVCLLAFIVALVPFGIIYGPVLATGAKRDIAEYLSFAPGLPDLVNVGLRNLIWSPLVRSLELVTDQRLGFGEVSVAITPVVQLLTLAAAAIAAGKRLWGDGDANRIMRAVAIGSTIVCVAFFLVVIKSDGNTLFGLLYAAIPGATAIRVGYRGMVVANLFAVAAIAVVFDRVCLTWLQHRMTLRVVASLVAIIALLTLAAVEQVNLASRASLSRAYENARLSNIRKPPDECRSFYVADQPDHQPYEVQIDAMMIALKQNLPTLNGYSGLQPEGWDLYETGKPTYQEKMLRWATRRGGVAGLCRLVVQQAEWTIVADDVALMALVEKGSARIAFDQTRAFHIVFGGGGNGDSFTDDRWWGAEPWGRWMQSKHASIVFILPNDQSAHFSMVLQGFLSDQSPRQSVWVDANGCRVGGGRFDLARNVNRLTISGSIPPICIRKDGVVTLNINTNRAVTPKDIGINEDTRTLGVGIVEIMIREGVPANRL